MASPKRRGCRRLKSKGTTGLGEGKAEDVPGTPGGGDQLITYELKPTEEQVLAAVESLYNDQVRPFGRIVRKRISEQLSSASSDSSSTSVPEGAVPSVGLEFLRSLCNACPKFNVEPEDGGAWSVLLAGREATFVDVYSQVDSYPEGMWKAAEEYFGGAEGADMCLPGGRYACAAALQAMQLPFFEGLSLGQICHVVQLALVRKKIFGYLHGNMVPYGRSQSMVKENCAVWQQPCGTMGSTPMPMASWESARDCLREILTGQPGGKPGRVPMSNVKRLFRSRFQVELSETVFGYTRLYELLQDARFSDICSVELQGNGYMVVQATESQGKDTEKESTEWFSEWFNNALDEPRDWAEASEDTDPFASDTPTSGQLDLSVFNTSESSESLSAEEPTSDGGSSGEATWGKQKGQKSSPKNKSRRGSFSSSTTGPAESVKSEVSNSPNRRRKAAPVSGGSASGSAKGDAKPEVALPFLASTAPEVAAPFLAGTAPSTQPTAAPPAMSPKHALNILSTTPFSGSAPAASAVSQPPPAPAAAPFTNQAAEPGNSNFLGKGQSNGPQFPQGGQSSLRSRLQASGLQYLQSQKRHVYDSRSNSYGGNTGYDCGSKSYAGNTGYDCGSNAYMYDCGSNSYAGSTYYDNGSNSYMDNTMKAPYDDSWWATTTTFPPTPSMMPASPPAMAEGMWGILSTQPPAESYMYW